MRFYSVMCVVLCVFLVSQQSFGQETPPIGSKAPPFTLHDQNGKQRSLDDLLKDGNIALVFHRSASW